MTVSKTKFMSLASALGALVGLSSSASAAVDTQTVNGVTNTNDQRNIEGTNVAGQTFATLGTELMRLTVEQSHEGSIVTVGHESHSSHASHASHSSHQSGR